MPVDSATVFEIGIMFIKTPASMPQYLYVCCQYVYVCFNTTSLFRAREGLGKRRTGTRQGLYYSSWMVCGLYRDGGNLYSEVPSPLHA